MRYTSGKSTANDDGQQQRDNDHENPRSHLLVICSHTSVPQDDQLAAMHGTAGVTIIRPTNELAIDSQPIKLHDNIISSELQPRWTTNNIHTYRRE